MAPPKLPFDRKQLYIPKPYQWDMTRLSRQEWQQRLNAATRTCVELRHWLRDREEKRHERQLEVFAGLSDSKLSEYVKSVGWRPPGVTELDDLSRQMVAIDKLLRKAEAAVDTIWRREHELRA